MKTKQKEKEKVNTQDSNNNYQITEFLKESSIIGNSLFMGTISFSIILIILAIIYFLFNILSSNIIGLISFFIGLIISLFYYACQRRKKCKIRTIVDLKSK